MLLSPEGGLTLKIGFLSLIGWESVGNSNWYIFVILVLYALSYLAFRVLGTDRIIPFVWIVLVLTAGMVVACYLYGWPYLLAAVLGVTGIYVLKFHLSGSMTRTIVTHLMFTGAVVLMTMKMKLGNPVLQWLGKYLFEIYILQRIPMILGKRWAFDENVYLYVFFCLTITLVLTPLFHRGVSWLWNQVNRGMESIFSREI